MIRSASMMIVLSALLLSVPFGCAEDREHPTPTTDSDRLMELYLAKVEKIGSLLKGVTNESQAKAVTAEVLLIVQDMRELIPKMKQFSDKEQADTVSKYRVRIRKVNEQFAKDVENFVAIPGASEELIHQLKNLPPLTDGEP
ncbi:MAG: hypothetical protein Kow00105_18910 [Phycisphaeraceae bacterium]